MTALGNGTRTCGAYTLGWCMIKHLLKFSSSQKTVNVNFFFFLILVFHEELTNILPSVQFSSVAQSCPILCGPTDCQASLSTTSSRSLLTLMSTESVVPSNHHILCRPLLLPSVFPTIRVFSSESALHIRWPKYWSFSFSISPSNEYSGLISFRRNSHKN